MFNSKALNTVPFIISLASGVAAMSLMAPSAQAQAVPSDTVDEIALLPRIALPSCARFSSALASCDASQLTTLQPLYVPSELMAKSSSDE